MTFHQSDTHAIVDLLPRVSHPRCDASSKGTNAPCCLKSPCFSAANIIIWFRGNPCKACQVAIRTVAPGDMTSQASGIALSAGLGRRAPLLLHALKRCGFGLRAALVTSLHVLLLFWILTQAQPPEPTPPPIARMEVRTIVEVSASARDAASEPPAKPEPVAQEPIPAAPELLASVAPDTPATPIAIPPPAPPPKKEPAPVKPKPLPNKTPQPAAIPTQSESGNGSAAGAANGKGAEDMPATAARFDADYLHNPAPLYPQQSRRLKEEGTVQLLVLVSEHGDPQSVQVRKSSGFERLDEAALIAVRQWRFVPAKRGNVAIAAQVIVPINFRQR